MRFQKTNRSAYLNFLRAQFEAMTGQIQVQAYPYFMYLDPISICQLRCPSCPTGVENESRRLRETNSMRERTTMTLDFYNALLDEMGEYLFFIMLYNWGEPLLNRDLPAFIRKAKEYQICVEIHTNLSLRIDDAAMDDLLSSGVDVIAASIDGFSQETYQTYRRGGNFELAKNNIERLAATRDRLGLQTEIIWNFLVFRFNEHELDVVRQYCDKIGITFNRRDAFIVDPDWLPSYRQHEAEELRNPISKLKPDNVQLVRQVKPCGWHYGYSAINANGSVSPCCAPWEQKYDFGFIQPGTVSFGDIWNNSMYRKSRAVFANKSVPGLEKIDTLCMHCPYGDIQNMYAYLDKDVHEQFRRVFAGKDSLLDEGMRRFFAQEGFLRFYIQSMGKFYIEEQASDAVIQAVRGVPSKIKVYEGVKTAIKPYTARLFKIFPQLYWIGKAIEKKF